MQLFEKELSVRIPDTVLLHPEQAAVTPFGVVLQGNRILPESFPDPGFMGTFSEKKARIRILAANLSAIFAPHATLDQDAFWITDTWSNGYFHWMTDALPRLFAIRDKLKTAILLLPGKYNQYSFAAPSLKPFEIAEIQYVQRTTHCRKLAVPTHTAPTGNYNEDIMKGLRKLYAGYFGDSKKRRPDIRAYISRSKASKRRIANEEECIDVLRGYGFEVFHFEDYSLEQQIRLAQNIQYLVSNHGAGLANMLFMDSTTCVLELRKLDDAENNCFFSLASALDINYFYQLCRPKDPGEDAHEADLVVDCELLRGNIEQMIRLDGLS